MRLVVLLTVSALAAGSPARAQSELEKGFDGALRGCEEWVLNPSSWRNGPAPFVKAVGLGDKMGLVEHVEEVSLPPQQFRAGNHYWRINSKLDAGYILVVSDQLPICHITGGGDTDLQPIVNSVLASSAFASRWEFVKDIPVKDNATGEMASSLFRNRKLPALSIVISRAEDPGQRLDRVQVLATASYNIE